MYERYAERVRGFCARRLDDPHEAADAVQDTFLRAWLALRKGTQVRYPLPWLLTIADNVCVSRFRARGARVATTTLSAGERVEFPEATYATAGLAAALRTLPQRQRQALLRREVQGYSYDEIGAELGVSRASVAALLHRARLTVAGKLRDAREVAALAPIPAFLRTTFEGGGAGLAAGAAAVAIAVAPLAHPSPALPAPPSRSADAAETVLDAEQASASTAHARPSSRTAAYIATEASPAGGPRVEISRAEGEGELEAARGPEPVPGFPVPADAVPTDEYVPAAPASPTGVEPRPDADPPGTAVKPSASAGGEEQPEADAPAGGGRPVTKSLPPGQQPKGSRGRSVYAPGQTKPGEAPDGENLGAAQSRSGNPEKGERPLPETRGDESTHAEDPSGETVPGADAARCAGAGQELSTARKGDTEPKADGEGVDHAQSKEEKDDEPAKAQAIAASGFRAGRA
jgi:RNA polymerase sigma-70 factor, ECF subfamily